MHIESKKASDNPQIRFVENGKNRGQLSNFFNLSRSSSLNMKNHSTGIYAERIADKKMIFNVRVVNTAPIRNVRIAMPKAKIWLGFALVDKRRIAMKNMIAVSSAIRINHAIAAPTMPSRHTNHHNPAR